MKYFFIAAFSLAFVSLGQAEVDFKKDVLPVFEKHCMSCHRAAYKDPVRGRTKKPKSGYRMDSVLLPEDDDWAMPTKGDRVPKEDIAKVEAWIKAGAKFGDWKETKFTPAGDKVEK